MLKKFLFLLMFLLIIVMVSANVDYNSTGFDSGDFIAGTGIFNTQIQDDSVTGSKTITSEARKHPLVADLDGDGISEIIILDGANIKLFHNKELDIVDSFTLPATTRLSNMIVFDIDDDGFTEIIVMMSEEETLQILEYNGTDFFNQTSIFWNASSTNRVPSASGQMIACKAPNDCLMAFNEEDIGSTTARMTVVPFDSTEFKGELNFALESGNRNFCFPKVKSMPVVDYDNDGDKEFFVSFILTQGTTTGVSEVIQTSYFSTQSGGVTLEGGLTKDLGDVFTSSTTCLTEGSAGLQGVTAPLIADVDPTGRLEVIIGYMTDTDAYRMSVFETTTNTELEQHPEFFEADGILIGNPILMNVFGDTPDGEDYCVSGYDNDKDFLDPTVPDNQQTFTLLCGSVTTESDGFFTFDSLEFVFQFTGEYNISQSFDNYEILTHRVEMEDNKELIGEGDIALNLPEVMTSYGVFRMEDDSSNGSRFIKQLQRIYVNGEGQASLIPVNLERLGTDSDTIANNNVDIIGLSAGNIFYIDDGISEGAATFGSDPLFDPCVIATTIKVNESLDISFIVIDTNPLELGLDPVSSRVTVYNGDDNQQSSNITNTISGANHQYINEFILNKTITNGEILIEVFDNESIRESVTQLFKVGLNGLEKGDQTCTLQVIEPEVPLVTGNATLDNIIAGDPNDNAVINFLVTIAGETRVSVFLIFLIIQIIITISIFVGSISFFGSGNFQDIMGMNTALIMAIIFNVLWIFLGLFLGVYPFALIIIMVLITGTMVTFWLRRIWGTSA